jgi:hypothetical protein
MSGLLPKADIRQRIEHVCFVPRTDISSVLSLREEGTKNRGPLRGGRDEAGANPLVTKRINAFGLAPSGLSISLPRHSARRNNRSFSGVAAISSSKHRGRRHEDVSLGCCASPVC